VVASVVVAYERELAGVVLVAVVLEGNAQFGVRRVDAGDEPTVVTDLVLELRGREPVPTEELLHAGLHCALWDLRKRITGLEQAPEYGTAVPSPLTLPPDERLEACHGREAQAQGSIERHLDDGGACHRGETEQGLVERRDRNAVDLGGVVGEQQARLVDHQPRVSCALPPVARDLDDVGLAAG